MNQNLSEIGFVLNRSTHKAIPPGSKGLYQFSFTDENQSSQACAKDGGHESMFKKMGTNDPKVCTEACIKGGSKYVLFKADKMFYQLDDQQKPAPFAGQKVDITGTLNKATKTIHVTEIKAAS